MSAQTLLPVLLLLAVAAAVPWDAANDPHGSFGAASWQYQFAKMATKGQTATIPWSDT